MPHTQIRHVQRPNRAVLHEREYDNGVRSARLHQVPVQRMLVPGNPAMRRRIRRVQLERLQHQISQLEHTHIRNKRLIQHAGHGRVHSAPTTHPHGPQAPLQRGAHTLGPREAPLHVQLRLLEQESERDAAFAAILPCEQSISRVRGRGRLAQEVRPVEVLLRPGCHHKHAANGGLFAKRGRVRDFLAQDQTSCSVHAESACFIGTGPGES